MNPLRQRRLHDLRSGFLYNSRLDPRDEGETVSDQPDFRQILNQIDKAMLCDRFRLRRSLDSVRRAQREKKPFDQNLKKLQAAVDESAKKRETRAASVPKVTLNETLPITGRREEIAAAIRDNQVVIVCGETGSGKSTQLPMICLDIGRGIDGLIGHTQPRRIAARSVAARVAEELGTSVGQQVGFKIRFTDSTGPQTFIKLMTDGILLAESQNDRFFEQYDTIIIDEAHERSLNIDFLLGRLRQMLSKRPDLKLIITSATIDAARFAEHFGESGQPAPVIEVAGRTFPVEMRYRPLVDDEEETPKPTTKPAPNRQPSRAGQRGRRSEPDVQRAILDAVDELGQIDNGDILIFMPTERDIHETSKSLRGRLVKSRSPTEILPLYARLTTNDQNRIFKPSGNSRRIVIATNVAESSLTVPGIRYVIDTGTARISRYSARSRMQRLPIEPVSRASASQRAGRCGRVAPGVCIRLYSEADFNARDEFTSPEIQRTNLASVILQTKALRLGPLEEFPFLEPPRSGTITDGYKMLFELGALDEKNELTEIGRKLARLPVDPRVGRIILAGHDENCLSEVLIIAAALEMQDPRERPLEHQQAADTAHEQFQNEDSDFLSYLALWDFHLKLKRNLSRGQLRKACQQNFLSFNRMREWSDVHHQIRELVEEAGFKPQKRRDDADAIHRAMLPGFLSNIATLTERHEYTAANNQKVSLWPGSGLFSRKPKWIVAAELVETTRRYVRVIARIQPGWIEPLAAHLTTKSYSDVEWDGKLGSAMAYEKVTLFGLPVVPRRRVRYAKINPQTSREMMIREGLVEGELELDLPFFKFNARLIEELESLQTKTRRQDLVIDDDDRYGFYDERIPHDVADLHALKRWLKTVEKHGKGPLHMQHDEVRREGTEEVTDAEFPAGIQIQDLKLPLEYHLDPGSVEDGISIAVPKEALNQLDQRRLGWLVPGLIEEKVVALIRSLPKSQRRLLNPAAESATRVCSKLKFGQGDFEATVAKELAAIAQEPVLASDFDLDRLPNHLRMNVRVIDAEGETLSAGRDVKQLRQKLGGEASSSFSNAEDSRWNRDGITEWDFRELPAQVKIVRAGLELTGYPTLIDKGESVSLRLLDMPARSAIETRAGLRRLAAISLRKFVRSQVENIPQLGQWTMNAAAFGGAVSFRDDLGDLIVDRAFFPTKGAYPRTEAEFQQRLKKARGLVAVAVQDAIDLLAPIMDSAAKARKSLKDVRATSWFYARDDAKEQLRELTRAGFLCGTQWGWLRQFPRYLDAISVRMRKLTGNGVARDQANHSLIENCLARYRHRAAEHAEREHFDPQLDYYRWMIEEFRVSLFAQELGTAIPVSEVRLQKQWEKVSE